MREKLKLAIDSAWSNEVGATDLIMASNKCYDLHKEESIRFAEWIHQNAHSKAGITLPHKWYYFGFKVKIKDLKERTMNTTQLFDLFNEDKTIKP